MGLMYESLSSSHFYATLWFSSLSLSLCVLRRFCSEKDRRSGLQRRGALSLAESMLHAKMKESVRNAPYDWIKTHGQDVTCWREWNVG